MVSGSGKRVASTQSEQKRRARLEGLLSRCSSANRNVRVSRKENADGKEPIAREFNGSRRIRTRASRQSALEFSPMRVSCIHTCSP